MPHCPPRCCVPLLLVLLASGCGTGATTGPGDDSHHVTVTGHVTLDGQPVANGTIEFSGKADARIGRPPALGTIENGAYTLRTPPGPKTVRITAPEADGEPDATGVAETVETLPDRYNTDSTLTIEVLPDGEQVHDFELTSEESEPSE